jgi:hypothetical protein
VRRETEAMMVENGPGEKSQCQEQTRTGHEVDKEPSSLGPAWASRTPCSKLGPH